MINGTSIRLVGPVHSSGIIVEPVVVVEALAAKTRSIIRFGV